MIDHLEQRTKRRRDSVEESTVLFAPDNKSQSTINIFIEFLLSSLVKIIINLGEDQHYNVTGRLIKTMETKEEKGLIECVFDDLICLLL